MKLLQKLFAFLIILTQPTLIWAQEKKVDVAINVGKGENSTWYLQPWVWIVGGAVFILLLVALIRGKKD